MPLAQKLFYFLGPNPALLSICPAMAEDESQASVLFEDLGVYGSGFRVQG